MHTLTLCGNGDGRRVVEIWKDHLFNDFHDILPGTCIESAEQDALKLYGRAEESARRLRMAAAENILLCRITCNRCCNFQDKTCRREKTGAGSSSLREIYPESGNRFYWGTVLGEPAMPHGVFTATCYPLRYRWFMGYWSMELQKYCKWHYICKRAFKSYRGRTCQNNNGIHLWI